ncbi:MAG: PEP-CTERM sorting domain-containing protein [Thermoguttaceae bacterium]|jgi:hypothetical protein
MCCNKSILFIGVGLALLIFAQSAVADDISPPSWRGQPGTTREQWEFTTDNARNGVAPDNYFNPFGVPSLTMHPDVWPPAPDPYGFDWTNSFLGRQGVYSLSGSFDITIPNAPIPNDTKKIWLQMTWYEQFPINIGDYMGNKGDSNPDYGPTGIYISSSTPPPLSTTATLISDTLVQPPVHDPWSCEDNNWHQSVIELTMSLNPSVETIHVRAPIYVDEVVVDTICIPEPSALILLCMGTLSLLAYVRRMRKSV